MEEAGQTRSVVIRIRKRQAVFIGHIMRREGFEHLRRTTRQGGGGGGIERQKNDG